jgi:integrase/recombinase XerD
MRELTRSRLSRKSAIWLTQSPLDHYADRYLQYLSDRGYCTGSISAYLESVAHFAHWMVQRRLVLAKLDEGVIDRFLDRHLAACRCARRCQRVRYTVRAALKHLIALLRREGEIAPPRALDPTHLVAELDLFEEYLEEIRGLTVSTRYQLRGRIRNFLRWCFGAKAIDLRCVKRDTIGRFLQRSTAHWTPQSRAVICVALRAYFRFKALQGEPGAHLLAAFPRFANWQLARLPQVLCAAQIRQFLKAFDRNCIVGRRDYAVARCLVDLGLRAAEVARLSLDDLDWRRGTIQIRGKGQRVDLLPLPAQTGRAIAQYLSHGRPSSPTRILFVRHRAPLDKPISAGMVRQLVCRTAERIGLATLTHGPHLLRHTAAQRLIHAGVTLKGIADFLRHRSLDTTTIYTKVDLRSLRRVALPWTGRQL